MASCKVAAEYRVLEPHAWRACACGSKHTKTGGGGGSGGSGGSGGAGGGEGGGTGGAGGDNGTGGATGGSGGCSGGTGGSSGDGGDGGSYGVISGRQHMSHWSARLQSGSVALPMRLTLSHERHASPYRHGVAGGGGTQSSPHRCGPSNAFGGALRKHVE